jgi:hypothetical protein
MTDFSNINDNPQLYSPGASTLIDEASSTEYYIGTSSGSAKGENIASWSIKKIWKDGNIWRTQFPNGDQSFIFVWNDRLIYTYQ